jgi:formylglycine-generating enzyme required for sulfatase activity
MNAGKLPTSLPSLPDGANPVFSAIDYHCKKSMRIRFSQLALCLVALGISLLYARSAESPVPSPPWQPGSAWTNSLGMVFRTVTNCPVLFSMWETRVQDFECFVTNSHYQPEPLTVPLPDGTSRTRDWRHPGFSQTPKHPVVMVSWEDAREFCAWLTHHERSLHLITGNECYRLPTDQEWTLAVGAAKYPWALPAHTNQPSSTSQTLSTLDADDRLWFPPPPGAGNYAGAEISTNAFPYRALRNYQDGYPNTAPVGSFMPNANGLFDLGGNVAEFCQDWFRQDMNSAALRPKLPFYSNDGGGHTYRVVRGASWIDSHPGLLRSDCHFFEFPDHRSDNLGFRIVLSSSW